MEWLAKIDMFELLMVGAVIWMAYILIYFMDTNRRYNDRCRTKKVKD